MANPNPFTPADGLRVIAACPLCEERYTPLQASVIAAREGAHLLHLECRNCGGAVIAAIRNDQQVGVSSIGLLTDLTSDDVVKFVDARGPATADDVLELHRLFQDDRGATALLATD